MLCTFCRSMRSHATVEEIVSICFRLFPQSFALKNYPRWPDSALVTRRLNDGREKGHIKGNSMDGFSLKYKGKQLAKRVAKVLGLIEPVPVMIRKKTVPSKKETAPAKSVKVKAKRVRAKVISQKKKIIATGAMKKPPKKQLSKSLKKLLQNQSSPHIKRLRQNKGLFH